MSVSIHDVAKRAGVSISTVSRVINHSAGVKESKTAAVLEAMEYYNYQPSQFGRGLVTGSSQIVGVYSPLPGGGMFQDGYMLECLRGIECALSKSQYSLLLIGEVNSFEKNEKAAPGFLDYVNQKKIDGLIVLSVPEKGAVTNALEAVMAQDFPVGYIGKRFSGCGNNVYAMYEEYMLDSIKRLHQQGHENIVLLTNEYRLQIHRILIEKCKFLYPQIKISLLLLPDKFSADMLQETLAKQLLENHCTGLICEMMEFVPQLISILHYSGLEVPEDISVISVEHVKGRGEQIIPAVNAYYVPAMAMGETVADYVLEQLSTGRKEVRHRCFQPEYQIRESVKCLNI